MSLRFIGVSLLALAIASSAAFARISKDQIHCPAINLIQDASEKMDHAEKYGAGYVAFTSQIAFQEDSRPWYVGAASITATSEVEALATGKNIVKNISFKKNEIAIKKDEFLLCLYGNGDVVAATGDCGVNKMMFKR